MNSPNPKKDKTAAGTAAFFDFDQTLLEKESGEIGLKMMKERGELSLGFMLKALAAGWLFRRDLITDEFLSRVLLKFYCGRRLDDFEAMADDFYDQYLRPWLAPNLLARLNEHKQKGHVLVLISGGIRYWLEPVVKDLGFDHLLCTDLEVGADGLLTGRARGEICLDRIKRDQALRLAAEHDIDLSRSYAYGNHHSDLALLNLVGRPFAVEPTPVLARTARKKGWPILAYK